MPYRFTIRPARPLPILLIIASALGLHCSDDVTGPTQLDPECEILSPADGSTFIFGDSVIVRVSADDRDGEIVSVTFYDNGVIQSTDTDSPYVYVLSNLSYRTGSHVLRAVAADDDDLASEDIIEISITSGGTPVYSVVVKNEFDHDEDAFTQGLVYDGEHLYEGTGLWGQSSVRRVDLETGEVLARRDIPDQYFGEGITIWQDKIYQITWRSEAGFVYSKATLDSLDSFSYDTEGWGLTNDDRRLIMSDGTPTIYFRDPDTFELLGELTVTDRGSQITRLNELEYIEGDLFANVWRSDRIARISLETGEVVGWIDLEDISGQFTGVLNGIAFDEAGRRLFITGKNWDTLYEIELAFD